MSRQLIGSVLATLALLGGVVGARAALRVPSGNSAGYLAGCRDAAEGVPMHVGLWFGRGAPVPTQAVDLLKPNVLVSRQYENLTTGRQFTLLLVQTRDARDLLGHFPPICYPGRGFVLTDQADAAWTLPADGPKTPGGPEKPGGGAVKVPAKRYDFSLTAAGGTQAITVVNFMLSPDGAVAPDMYALERHLTDRTKTHYGAAEVQMVFPGDFPAAERDATVEQFLRAARPALAAILDGYDAG